MQSLLLKNGTIYSEQKKINNGYVQIENNKITGIGETAFSAYSLTKTIELPWNYHVIPGMMDLHIHGANGADTMDGTKEALDTLSQILPKEGVTSYLATTMTENTASIENALTNINQYMEVYQEEGQAELLGVHLEGPFIHKNKAGAQPIQYVQDPSISLFKSWEKRSNHHIKLVTLAPELPQGLELIKYLTSKNIISSVAHSEATYEQTVTAIHHGLSHITHLFNQMPGIHHREPGVVGAAFLHDEVMVEMIADGIHVQPEIVKLAYNQITRDRLILISDAMRAKWLKDGIYELGGQLITVKNGKALLSEDTLAGSVLKMIDAFKNIQHFTGCSIEAAIQMTSENPAKQLNLFHKKGSLSVGKDADIVILDENLDVYMTICNGKIAYKRSPENDREQSIRDNTG
ncbi:N-acetylglucosamine-6-phosphate deacetylase [Bacillus weihaiensis]|uniref:N-acetylglucosamine-6-phosphate deacetylase n=1 Tax=Bacillus weihaiensis TaxID=1547283 RepID=A0A1L3MUG7_9BACI|nr:N-acetylglucosamine-6-phosphate deacetylase [Bacillus weihaiensis]APH05995.1 N-acetylglucosamine-6-phosphate deacetylase [Bacillus weihaiensis]